MWGLGLAWSPEGERAAVAWSSAPGFVALSGVKVLYRCCCCCCCSLIPSSLTAGVAEFDGGSETVFRNSDDLRWVLVTFWFPSFPPIGDLSDAIALAASCFTVPFAVSILLERRCSPRPALEPTPAPPTALASGADTGSDVSSAAAGAAFPPLTTGSTDIILPPTALAMALTTPSASWSVAHLNTMITGWPPLYRASVKNPPFFLLPTPANRIDFTGIFHATPLPSTSTCDAVSAMAALRGADLFGPDTEASMASSP